MSDLEYLYTTNLHKRLKARIRGKVFTKIENDELKIRIDSFDYWFEMVISDISKRIIYGIGTDEICEEVCAKFKKYLLNRMEQKYFKEDRVQA